MRKRSELILELVNSGFATSYKDLAKSLGVSPMTIRRDCEELARAGKIIRTVGGILRADPMLEFYEKTTEERIGVNPIEKHAIAKKALELIKPPCTVFIDGSTTGLALAKLIDKDLRGLTIVTHSLLVCLALTSGHNTTICAGGEFEPRSLCLVGSETERFARSIFIDIAFVSATGFLPTEGTFESSPATFRIKQEVAGQASELVLLADHRKFGRRALSKVLELKQISHVVTDDQVSEEQVAILRATGIKVTVASRSQDTFGRGLSNY
jgi:DeoR/GlpR family transcriptional regulator of sugar metabolism